MIFLIVQVLLSQARPRRKIGPHRTVIQHSKSIMGSTSLANRSASDRFAGNCLPTSSMARRTSPSNLAHLEQRMRQTGHWRGDKALSPSAFSDLVNDSIDRLDVDQARRDAAPFVKDQQMLSIWSHDFFRDVAEGTFFPCRW